MTIWNLENNDYKKTQKHINKKIKQTNRQTKTYKNIQGSYSLWNYENNNNKNTKKKQMKY